MARPPLVEDSAKVALGPLGPLDRWTAGPLDRWSAGPLVRWSAGPLVRWSAGLLGPLGLLGRWSR
ncbi:hypothetical protein ACTXO9_04645 [Brachybacterium tyrofermentans]|uniref:hypothetical protein n=1 Tax=Brachybacterium tyrofermentans TaxID=47848 RepID=UPI003FCF5B84